MIMMQPKTQQERIEKYGSFLWCPERKTLCFNINTPDGSCKRASCILDDPEYIKLQRRIEANRAKNARIAAQEREAEKNDCPAPIRRQTKTRDMILREEIIKKENLARAAYRRGWTSTGDKIVAQIARLEKQLKEENA